MLNYKKLNEALCKILASIENGEAGIDTYIESGSIVGSTLILQHTPFGTVNIPLAGVEAGINFNNLSQIQKQALQSCIRGDLVTDVFGVDLGYLLPLN